MPAAIKDAAILQILNVGDAIPYATSAAEPIVFVHAESTASINESLSRITIDINV